MRACDLGFTLHALCTLSLEDRVGSAKNRGSVNHSRSGSLARFQGRDGAAGRAERGAVFKTSERDGGSLSGPVHKEALFLVATRPLDLVLSFSIHLF